MKQLGRPSKYKPEYCKELLDHMREGFTLESFAGRIGVCRDTLHEWSNTHEDFSDATKRGKAASQYAWESKLKQSVDDKSVNAVPVLFTLKCRFGFREVSGLELSGPEGKPIETKNLSELPDDQIQARIVALQEKLKESK